MTFKQKVWSKLISSISNVHFIVYEEQYKNKTGLQLTLIYREP